MDAWNQLQEILIKVTQIADLLWPFAHPKQVVASLLKQSIQFVDSLWNGFILSTTGMPAPDFVENSTIRIFEPWVQAVADAALVLVVMWAGFRIMWGHGLFTQYTARILLPRLFMAAVLVNFSQPLIQLAVDASNAASSAIGTFVSLRDPLTLWQDWINAPSAGFWEIVTTAALAAGYDVLAITYFVRYAVLIVLAITAPLAGLLFLLPETQHIAKMWATHFTTSLFMQPAQLFVLAIGFALERNGTMPLNHIFAVAILLIVFKVPGALGSSEKAAHKLQSTVTTAFHHLAHAAMKA